MESDSSETNLFIMTRRQRFMLFSKLYWRYLVIFLTPVVLLPIAFLGSNAAYKCFYVFLLAATYWVTDAIHPSIVGLMPVALSSVMDSTNLGFIGEMYVRNELLDCTGVMLLVIAIEECQVHRRIAIKLLLIFGCSHYRLSFLLFFCSMFLSMWISSIMTCGLMMPITKAILVELEMMGMLEMYEIVGKARHKSLRHGEKHPRPSDTTVFYFLGIAYSSTIGASGTLLGSQTNQIFKIYCEMLFPNGPKIEFPRFLLLNLPGIIMMETLLYFWMNFWFLGMFQTQNMSLEIGMSEEEAQYAHTLLEAKFKETGRVTFHEGIVMGLVMFALLLQATLSTANIDLLDLGLSHSHFRVSSPCLLAAFLLFIIPQDTEFTKFFSNRTDRRLSLPQTPSATCLRWLTVRERFYWSVLFIIGGSDSLFEALDTSSMTDEMEKFLLLFKEWSSPALMLVIIIFFKILTEFAPNSCVVFCLLPNIARLAVTCDINPHYLMLAATLAASYPFHLVTGTPVNSMVAAYVHIPPYKMMSGGICPSLCGIVTVWFTVAAWSAAVWTENAKQFWKNT